MSVVDLGFLYAADPVKGKPVSSGFVYVGEPDLDPETNQKQVTLRQEDGTLVATGQPISLGGGGVPLYNGSPVQLLVSGDYSIKILDKNLAQVYYLHSVRASVEAGQEVLLADLMAITNPTQGDIVITAGRTALGDGGDGRWAFDSSDLSSEIAADPNKRYGLFAPPASDLTGASGAWRRLDTDIIKPAWFGTVGDGDVTQDILDFISFLGSGHLQFPPDVFSWATSVPALPKDIAGHLTISAPGSQITLSANAPRLFDFGRTADYDTFQNITIKNFHDIDCNAIGNRQHVVLGTYIAGANQKRLNFDNITLENIYAYNAPTNPVIATDHRLMVSIVSAHTASAEATQTTITGITCRNVKMSGGNAGILITGNDESGGNNANVWIDDILIEDCDDQLDGTPTQLFASSNYHIGQDALVGRVRVLNCFGKNAGDNGVEINNALDAKVDATIEDSWNLGCYVNNYQTLADVTLQNVDVTLNADVIGRSFAVGESNPLGHISFNGHLVTNDSNNENLAGKAVSTRTAGTGVAVKSLNIGDVTIEHDRTIALTADTFPSFFDVHLKGHGKASIGNVTINTTGAVTPGAFNYLSRIGNIDGDDLDIDIENINYNMQSTVPAASTLGFNFGELEAAGAINGNIRRLKIASTDNTKAVKVRSTATLTLDASHKITIDQADVSACAAGSACLVNDDAANIPYIRTKNNRELTAPAAAAVALGGSPHVEQNLSTQPLTYIVTGGTVSEIAISDDGATYYPTGLTAGSFYVDHTNYIRVTYSVAPTVTSIPQGNL